MLALLLVIVTSGTGLTFGLEFAGGAWNQSPAGQLGYEEPPVTGITLDLEQDLKYTDEWRFFGWIDIDMPLFIPNIYLMATPVEFEGNGSKSVDFKFGDTIINGSAGFFSKLTLNHADIALYYGIPLLEKATLETLNIDIGLNIRIYDIEAQIVGEEASTSTPIDITESVTLPIPQVFLALQFRPLDWLALEAEGRGISISSNKAYSLIGRLRWNVVGPLFFTGGYRYDKIDIDEEDVRIDIDISGPFVEAGFAF
ncbi:MAG: hypothetical protein AMJ54_04730 [Deltaproteobacteria bacterium SG8_13]|nr:MAG: hypothetical protein AMJ54_04730 [Deltaproteobacteria bacterium SG8_13]